MLTSLGIILLVGLSLGKLFQKMKLPSLMGMILGGILVGPQVLGLLDPTILEISSQLRQLALVIILTRAGLSLDINDLKKVGRPAIMLCFVPATLEIVGIVLIAPLLFPISYVEAAVIGCVLAAVSPAVVVPRMIRMMEEGYGVKKSIPQMIMAGASVDDVYVIVLFTSFTALASGGSFSVANLIKVPISIVVGVLVGMICGYLYHRFVNKYSMRDSVKIIILLSVSFLLLELQAQIESYVPISGLLAIMSMGIMLYQKNEIVAKRLSVRYNKMWVAAELLLFVLVGASVNIAYVKTAGLYAICVVLFGLIFRMCGVWMSVLKTPLIGKERLFCMVAYTPKATVQAAIGGIPLAMGLPCGELVLTIAVLAILITAPFGAICVDCSYKRFTQKA